MMASQILLLSPEVGCSCQYSLVNNSFGGEYHSVVVSFAVYRLRVKQADTARMVSVLLTLRSAHFTYVRLHVKPICYLLNY